MVKTAYVDKNGIRRGAWSEEEDNKLKAYVQRYGHWNWRLLPTFAGLARCGKSCRLRWVNYLKPGLKRGNFSREEKELVVRLHKELGSKWSTIASRLPGRTDSEIKNFWHTHIKKGVKENSSGKEPIAPSDIENNQSGGDDQDEQSSELYQNQIPPMEDLARRESPMDVYPPPQNRPAASAASPENVPPARSSPFCSIPPNFGWVGFVQEDDPTALGSLLLPSDSFWNEPFLVDSISSEGNNSSGLSSEFMNPYTSYDGDVTDIFDQFM